MRSSAVFLVLSIALQTATAAFGKLAAVSMPRFTVAHIAANPFYLLSLVCLALHAVTWQLTLSRYPLSRAYAALAFVYVNTLLLSAFVFRERVTFANVAGAALIAAGVCLVVAGKERIERA